MVKDRNDKDITELEDINKQWQEHKEELYTCGGFILIFGKTNTIM